MIRQKFITAKKVLLSRGFLAVFSLLIKNLKKYFVRFGSFLNSRLWMIRVATFDWRSFSGSGKLNILYIADRLETENGLTIHYRIHNLREALHKQARTHFEIIENGVYRRTAYLSWADVIVLMRLEWSPMVEQITLTAKMSGIPVVYDIDDILFRPNYSDYFCAILSDGTQTDKEKYRKIFLRQSMMYGHADYATVSTQFIANMMGEDHKSAFVIHNGLNKKQIQLSKRLLTLKNNSPVRYIGYLSGSATHNQDFKQAELALIRILKEYPDIEIRIVGYLDINELEKDFPNRIERIGFVDWEKMMKLSSQNYINIAPLDVNNPFCHAKSELKYFEAAVVGVPTVASCTDTFVRCIQNGYNGMLASNPEEWYQALKKLLDNEDVYGQISKNAKEHALLYYSPQAIAKEAINVYQEILKDYARIYEN